MPNISPWIAQLTNRHSYPSLTESTAVNVVVIGGGIAGITTALYILKHTDKSVMILESNKIAHGATGHNAGQVVSYFERQLSDLVREYGFEKAIAGQKAVYNAWDQLTDIMTEFSLTTPLQTFTGYAGCQDLAEILVHLENNWYSREAHIPMEPLIIAEEQEFIDSIPEKFSGLYTTKPQKYISELLQTEDSRYIAIVSEKKGCMNSALFCDELLGKMSERYDKRLRVFEQSHVIQVQLQNIKAQVSVNDLLVFAEHVVLCTNGFEKFTIKNNDGPDVDTGFHHVVSGAIGYMAAFVEKEERPGVAISYLPKRSSETEDALESDPYFYLTRRTFSVGETSQPLLCIGGPEITMEDTTTYIEEKHHYSGEAQVTIDAFLHNSYKFSPREKIDYAYTWHGLMGYTPNGVRCVGVEPIHSALLYNLGCNGVGILPSIYGGLRISQILKGEILAPSIFDPQDSRDEG